MKKKVDEHIEELKKQVDEWKGRYLRALADYQNLEKRIQAERHEIRRFAAEVILGRLLPILDILRRAQDHLKNPGLNLAVKEFLALLTAQGVEKIEVIGREFDPHQMECVEVVAGEDNRVMDEVRPGYRFRDKILRVAQVKVGKSAIDEKAEELAKEQLQKGDYM